MDRAQAQAEMLEGYRDGLILDNPEPTLNRSWSYRHGFANARDDKAGQPRDRADHLRSKAESCIILDMEGGYR